MKRGQKLTSLLLALALLLTMGLAAGCEKKEQETPEPVSHTDVSASDFDPNVDNFETDGELSGWVGRDDGGNVLLEQVDSTAHTGKKSLRVSGRVQDWQGTTKTVDLISGVGYDVSCWVYQETGEPKTLILSVTVNNGELESYINIVRGSVPSGEWTLLKGVYTPNDADKYSFYIETSDSAGMTYYIDDFSAVVAGSANLPSGLVSLKDTYASCFDIGAAVSRSPFGSESSVSFIKEQYSTFTHENELKPESVIDFAACREAAANGDETHPVVSIARAEPLLKMAKESGAKVHGHVLVWHSQTPEGFFRKGYVDTGDLLSREEMLERMENYIKAVLTTVQEQYPGVIVSWDVVNEAVQDANGQLRVGKEKDAANGSRWMDTVGDDFIDRAFEFARKYADKDVKLFYNDYSVPTPVKLAGIKRVVERLNAAGTIDGVGMQGHYSIKDPSLDRIETAMKTFIDMGLSLRISELDIEANDNSEEQMIAQANRYAQLMELFKKYSDSIDAVVFWGLNDSTSWKAEKFPLLFDADYAPKYAFYALTEPEKVPKATKLCIAYGEAAPDSFAFAAPNEFGGHSFKLLYDASSIYGTITVADATSDADDKVIAYIGGKPVEFARADCSETEGGYVCDFTLENTCKAGETTDFDISVSDGGKELGWNDDTATGTSRVLGKISFKELPAIAKATKGTPKSTKKSISKVWSKADAYAVDRFAGTPSTNVKVTFKTMWDAKNLYVLARVEDGHLSDASSNAYEHDCLEVFLDEGSHRAGDYADDDGHYRVNFNNYFTADNGTAKVKTITYKRDYGFDVELTIPLSQKAEKGKVMGFDVRYNNTTSLGMRTMLNFNDTTDTGWSDTSVFGFITLD